MEYELLRPERSSLLYFQHLEGKCLSSVYGTVAGSVFTCRLRQLELYNCLKRQTNRRYNGVTMFPCVKFNIMNELDCLTRKWPKRKYRKWKRRNFIETISKVGKSRTFLCVARLPVHLFQCDCTRHAERFFFFKVSLFTFTDYLLTAQWSHAV